MGWLISYNKLRHGETVDDRMRKEMSWSTSDEKSGSKHEIVASATVGSTWYAAVKNTSPDSASYTFTLICLTSKGKSGKGFGYKDMDETVGPCEINCPKRILDLLTPTDNEYANKWRDACHEKRATSAKQRAEGSKIVPGMAIKTAEPLHYSEKELDTFTIVPTPASDRGVIATAKGGHGLYRLPLRVLATATILSN